MSSFDVAPDSGASRSPTDVPAWLTTAFGLVVGSLALMWVVEIIDTIALDDRLQGGGIHPRALDGIDGILWAPFLHAGWGHLISNTIPFLVLGGLVAVRGMRNWLHVTGAIVLFGGAATWLLARGGNHVGASGVVFGYLGYLVGAALFERSLKAIALAVVAVMLYGGLIFGIVPTGQVSWEGHLFGAIAGLGVARINAPTKAPATTSPGTTDWTTLS